MTRVVGRTGYLQKGAQWSLDDKSGSVDRTGIIPIDWPPAEIWGYPNIDRSGG